MYSILKSNIDKNFTKHNYVKFGDLSHNITVCLIWTTRSPTTGTINEHIRKFWVFMRSMTQQPSPPSQSPHFFFLDLGQYKIDSQIYYVKKTFSK